MKLYTHFSANNIRLERMEFKMELSMESYIIENDSILRLGENIYSDVEIIDAELSIKSGRKSKESDGRIDLIALYDSEVIGVIELKKGNITEKGLSQLEDYLKETEQIFSKLQEKGKIEKERKIEDYSWIGILTGTGIDESVRKKIDDGYKIHKSIPLAGIVLDRFKGENGQVYILSDTYFKPGQNQKNYDKYEFNGVIYGKNRLVFAVVYQYAQEHPNITYTELQSIFPFTLQGNEKMGVFRKVLDAKQIYAEWGYKRHYINDDQIIQIGDAEIVICNQWGGNMENGNIGKFINHVRKILGYSIKPV